MSENAIIASDLSGVYMLTINDATRWNDIPDSSGVIQPGDDPTMYKVFDIQNENSA